MNILKNILTVAGQIVNYNGTFYGTVVIDCLSNLIIEIKDYNSHADIVCGPNQFIFPGFVDGHVHLRQDRTGKQNYKEDFISGGEAAINGGVVAVCSMPNTPEPPVNDEIYYGMLELTRSSRIDVGLYAAIAPGSSPLKRRVPYKGFLAESVNDLKFISKSQARGTLIRYPDQDVSLHCDDNNILSYCVNKRTHEDRRPAESEIDGIRFAIWIAQEVGFRLKVVHCSTHLGLREIVLAKSRGQKVKCEGTPHHMFYNRKFLEHLDKNGRKRLQMNPPLREPADQKAILNGLVEGEIDMLASDHAPHLLEEEKLSEKGASGVPHLDTYGLFATWLIKKAGCSPERLAAVASYNPGRWLSQFLTAEHGKKGLGYGFVDRGYIGSLTILDLGQSTIVDERTHHSKCKWSPFDCCKFPGQVAYTIVRGQVLKDPSGVLR